MKFAKLHEIHILLTIIRVLSISVKYKFEFALSILLSTIDNHHMLPSSHYILAHADQSILSQLTDKHQVTVKNTRLLTKYYTHFIKTLNFQFITPNLRKSLAQIALIFTEKSNFYQTLQGHPKPGICFSMNDILKHKSYEEIRGLIEMARDVVGKVKFREPSLKFETLILLEEIQKGLEQAILFEKLCWVFMKNTLQTSAQAQSYKQTLINFSWYLYIDVKSNCLPQNSYFITSKMLMVSVLQTIILHSLPYISPLILQKNSPKRFSHNPNQVKKQTMSSILQILLKQTQISPNQLIYYHQVNQTFNTYFDHLVLTSVIKSFSQGSFDFLSPRSLQINLRKLDRKISKEIQSSEIDLRRLISYELSIERGHKRTAIEQKLIVKHKKHDKIKNNNNNHEQSKKYKSHRVLNLDNCQVEMESSSIITQSQVSCFPSNLFGTTTNKMNLPGIHVRTQKDQLKTFISQKARYYMADVTTYQPSILNYIQNAFKSITERPSFARHNKPNHDKKSQTIYQAYQFYAFLADQIWPNSHTQASYRQYILEDSDSIHQCLLIVSIGTILLAQEETHAQNPFIKLLKHYDPFMIDFFYTLISVKDIFDLPMKLQSSLEEAMMELVNELMWSDQVFIQEINAVTQNYAQIHEQTHGKLALSCILQRVSDYISNKINKISSTLLKTSSLSTFNALHSWSQQSLNLALILTIYCPQLFHQRTLDQLMLCSLYGMSKFLKLSIRFCDLIETYHQTIANKPTQFQKTILHVKSSFSEQQTDLIGFYNNEFIGYLNYAFEILADRERMELVYELCGDNTDNVNMDPFGHKVQQPIILSPRLNKNKSQTQKNLMSLNHYTNDKQNHQNNSSHSISINLDHAHLGIISLLSDKPQQPITSQQGKIEINLQINQRSSRNPTRVKERRLVEERENELCATHKGKHPIFTEMSKIDEE